MSPSTDQSWLFHSEGNKSKPAELDSKSVILFGYEFQPWLSSTLARAKFTYSMKKILIRPQNVKYFEPFSTWNMSCYGRSIGNYIKAVIAKSWIYIFLRWVLLNYCLWSQTGRKRKNEGRNPIRYFLTCRWLTVKCRSPTSSGSSLGLLIRKEPMLVLRNLRQEVIQFCSSGMDIEFLDWTLGVEGSEDCRTCSVSTHWDRSYSDERKNENAFGPFLCAT